MVSYQPGPDGRKPSALSSRNRGRLVVAAVVLILLVVFVSQNTERVNVTFLFFDGRWPLWLLMLLVAIAGAILGQILEYVWERSRRKGARAAKAADES